MAVYGQKLDGRPPDERPKQLTPPSFGRDRFIKGGNTVGGLLMPLL